MPDAFFDEFRETVQTAGTTKSLEKLVSHFRNQKQLSLLFEARKMQVRHSMGLPLLYGNEPDELTESQQRDLEDGLLDVCREVGALFVKQGELSEGWLYLQPVGDKQLQTELFGEVVPTEDNVDELIQITFFQQAAPEVGYQLLIERQGTCASITAYERDVRQMDLPVQKRLAKLLVEHVYEELVDNIRGHIEEVEKNKPDSDCLGELIADRSFVTDGGSHHIDTTHLASVTRIGSVVDDAETLQKLFEFTQYGGRLHEDFQYPSDPPFENTYEDYGHFYQALTSVDGEKINSAISHFESKAEALDRAQVGAVAFETLMDLLHRIGRTGAAIDVYTASLYRAEDVHGLAPNVFEVANRKADLERLRDFFLEKEDLLGYSVCLLKSAEH